MGGRPLSLASVRRDRGAGRLGWLRRLVLARVVVVALAVTLWAAHALLVVVGLLVRLLER